MQLSAAFISWQVEESGRSASRRKISSGVELKYLITSKHNQLCANSRQDSNTYFYIYYCFYIFLHVRH